MNQEHVVKALAALAHSVRLQVFRTLVAAGAEGRTPSEIAEQLGIPSTALSFHLKELMAADLVSQERVGRNLFYRAAYDEMNALLGYLTENCCAGSNCGQAGVVCCPPTTKSTSQES
ncbi:ArsR/SmtB family transcription factor [Comamonas jiangduensis]|uniref:ArsR/SmtB family transcription factor n=1 Tax=Comamonas jiangduensis TaxID=1194168 RepID=A0ABV4I805_9BURK